jgi:hypothetical protein
MKNNTINNITNYFKHNRFSLVFFGFSAFLILLLSCTPARADRFYDWFHYNSDAALNAVWDKSGWASDIGVGNYGPSYHYSYATLDNLTPIGGFTPRSINLFRAAGFPLLHSTLSAVVNTLVPPGILAYVNFLAVVDPFGTPAHYESVKSWSLNTDPTDLKLIDIKPSDFVLVADGTTNPDLDQITHVGLRLSIMNPTVNDGFDIWSFSLTPEPQTYLMAGSALVLLLFLGL